MELKESIKEDKEETVRLLGELGLEESEGEASSSRDS